MLLFVDKHQGIVEAAALDKVQMQQRLYLVQKHESAAWGYAGRILRERCHLGRLPTDDGVFEIYLAMHGEVVAGLDIIGKASLLHGFPIYKHIERIYQERKE